MRISIPPVPPKMPSRFYLMMGKWGTGIDRLSIWLLLAIFLLAFVSFVVFLAIL